MLLRFVCPLIILIYVNWLFPEFPIKKEYSGNDSLGTFNQKFVPFVSKGDCIITHKGYSLCYSEEHEQARWVAYRLSAGMCSIGKEERTDNFRIDKSVPSGSASPADYKKSGYDRGHLCPAGDMGWDATAMSESFLMSNMSPQIPGFNRGIWKELESSVRNWAIRNQELYIITAGVLKEDLPAIGANKVSVPFYYYKVVLDIHPPDYSCIAFVLPNKASKESFFNYAVSVDSVEKLTGIDFFNALPDSLENVLEKGYELKHWKE